MTQPWFHPDDPGDVEGQAGGEAADVVQDPQTVEAILPDLGDDIVVEQPPRDTANPFEERMAGMETRLETSLGEMKDLLSKQGKAKASTDFDEDEEETPAAKRLQSKIDGLSESMKEIKASQQQQQETNKRYADHGQIAQVNQQAAFLLDKCNAKHALTASKHPSGQKAAQQVKAAVLRRVNQLVTGNPANHGLTVDHIQHFWQEELTERRDLLQAALTSEDIGKQVEANKDSGVEAGSGAPPTDKALPTPSPDSDEYWEGKKTQVGNRVSNRVATRQASQ